MTDNLVVPSIHINGTARDDLMRALVDANRALQLALDEMAKAAPNARDYYPQGGDAYGKAMEHHMDRMRRIASVQREILDIAIKIDEQGD